MFHWWWCRYSVQPRWATRAQLYTLCQHAEDTHKKKHLELCKQYTGHRNTINRRAHGKNKHIQTTPFVYLQLDVGNIWAKAKSTYIKNQSRSGRGIHMTRSLQKQKMSCPVHQPTHCHSSLNPTSFRFTMGYPLQDHAVTSPFTRSYLHSLL